VTPCHSINGGAPCHEPATVRMWDHSDALVEFYYCRPCACDHWCAARGLGFDIEHLYEQEAAE
jgi:hypothetical protein